MRFQVEHDTALMRAIRKNNESMIGELIKANVEKNSLDYENKVKLYCEFTVEMLSPAM